MSDGDDNHRPISGALGLPDRGPDNGEDSTDSFTMPNQPPSSRPPGSGYSGRPSDEIPAVLDPVLLDQVRREAQRDLLLDSLARELKTVSRGQHDLMRAHTDTQTSVAELGVAVRTIGTKVDHHLEQHAAEDTARKNRWNNVLPTVLSILGAAVATAILVTSLSGATDGKGRRAASDASKPTPTSPK